MHANVDPAETAKFDAHAGQWWDTRGPLRTLHEINPVRLAWVAGHVRLDGARVVDVGCGGGVLSEALARAGATVTGIDLAADALVAAREHAARARPGDRLPGSVGRGPGGERAGQFRRADLHGADRACAGSGRSGAGLRRSAAPGRPGVFLHPEPHAQSLRTGGAGGRVRAAPAAARHARLRAFPAPGGAGWPVPGGWTGGGRPERPCLQPAHAPRPAASAGGRELPAGGAQARPDPSWPAGTAQRNWPTPARPAPTARSRAARPRSRPPGARRPAGSACRGAAPAPDTARRSRPAGAGPEPGGRPRGSARRS